MDWQAEIGDSFRELAVIRREEDIVQAYPASLHAGISVEIMLLL